MYRSASGRRGTISLGVKYRSGAGKSRACGYIVKFVRWSADGSSWCKKFRLQGRAHECEAVRGDLSAIDVEDTVRDSVWH